MDKRLKRKNVLLFVVLIIFVMIVITFWSIETIDNIQTKDITAIVTPQKDLTCDVMPHSSKVDCGHLGITQQKCESDGCCWFPIQSESYSIPWCYEKGGIQNKTKHKKMIELAINSTSNETIMVKYTNISGIITTSWKHFRNKEEMVLLCVWKQQWNAMIGGNANNLKYFDNDKLDDFMLQNFPEWFVDDHFNKLSRITRADVFRLGAVYKYGGFWADFDAFPNIMFSFDEWLKGYMPINNLSNNTKIECIFGVEWRGVNNITAERSDFYTNSNTHIILIAQYFFGCEPNHILIKMALNSAMYKTQIKGTKTMENAGPWMLQNEIVKYMFDTTNAKQGEYEIYIHFHKKRKPFLFKKNIVILNGCAFGYYNCAEHNHLVWHRFMGSWVNKINISNEQTFTNKFYKNQPKLDKTKCRKLVDKTYQH